MLDANEVLRKFQRASDTPPTTQPSVKKTRVHLHYVLDLMIHQDCPQCGHALDMKQPVKVVSGYSYVPKKQPKKKATTKTAKKTGTIEL